MSDAIFKKIELVGTSATSIEEAVNNALAKAASTLRHTRWFEVVETRGSIEEGRVGQWQVTLKVGFKLEE
jgi:flavin-binding protein dodecin